MFYAGLNHNPDRHRIAERLLALKGALAAKVPAKSSTETLLATWNIREFDSDAYGDRSEECLFYIAEIMSHFDLIAVQEVREDLKALKRIVSIMGNAHWDYIVSDVSEGKPGNRERMAFVYDTRSVRFSSMAGEVVIPAKEVKQGNKVIRYDPAEQLYRTPYLCGFQLGWTKLMLCTVHILYGADTANNPKRVAEIGMVADFLAKRSRERRDYSNLVLLGDFNIYKPTDTTMKAITDAGFTIDPSLQSVPATNVGSKKRHYDQIAFRPKSGRFSATGHAGVFDFFEFVYTDADEATYINQMGPAYHVTKEGNPRDASGKRSYYRTYWRTHQMSDHLPMWIQLKTDYSHEYLNELRNS